MFELPSGWKEYYSEREPKRRRGMFESLAASLPDDGANAFRAAIFRARHVDEKRQGHEVDRMLFMCVSFMQLYHTARFFRNGARREVLRSMEELRFGEAEGLGEAGMSALYWEIRNAAARYLSTCESAGYNRAMFGLMPSREGGRADRICRDIWQMTDGLARRARMESEMSVWNSAVKDAYFALGGQERERFEAYDGKRLKR